MKTYTKFIAEAPTEAQVAKIAPGISPEKRRAALEKNARNQARRDTPTTPTKQKALPAGKSGGDIKKATTTSIVKPQSKSGGLAPRSGQIVKAKSNKLANPAIKKVDVKVDKPRPERPGTTRPESRPESKPETTTTKPSNSNTNGKKKRKKLKLNIPKISPLKTDDTTSTGDVSGLQTKNSINS